MIGAVIVAGFGAGIGADRQLEFLRGFFHGGIESGALRAAHFHFFGNADGRQVVIVQIENRLGGQLRGVFAKIFGAEQALLFGSDSGKKDGTRRRGLGAGPDATQFQQDAAARGVVRRAVKNVRARRLGFVDAEMIVVRGVENCLALFAWIGSFDHGQYVARSERVNGTDNVRLQIDGQRNRLEIAGLRLLK